MDDYEEVLEGCVAQLPGILAKADYAREKQDLTLIFKYLTDCCMMSGPPARRSALDSVLVRLVSTQARAFVRMLVEFNRLYATDAEEQYRALFLDPVCGTLENIVFEEDLVEECVDNGIADLFCAMLDVPYLVSSSATQQLIVFIAVLRKFFPSFRTSPPSDSRIAADQQEAVANRIAAIINSVTDPTCHRRLSRIIQ